MLLELAVGDAYGAGFEYVNPSFVHQYNTLKSYVQHPRHDIAPGAYTDDTQMSLAIAELIVSSDDWTPLIIANRFVNAFKRDPREGYAGRFYDFLINIADGEQFLRDIQPYSDKSGAAMRASAIGVYRSLDEVIEKATIQAQITHNTPDGIAAAVASALMSHYFIYDLGKKEGLGAFLDAHVPGDRLWSQVWRGKIKAQGWMSVQAAVTGVMRNARLSTLLKDCIDFTGDVDTVATIALAAASCSREYVNDLPQPLIDTLENGMYGRDYLVQLDAQLVTVS